MPDFSQQYTGNLQLGYVKGNSSSAPAECDFSDRTRADRQCDFGTGHHYRL
ncbi:MAG: hypothetical protein EBE86_017290 [Hormoscilla sp. GUM202]|nr:hypothetical protein [Hormoscilla sp. GUM202]